MNDDPRESTPPDEPTLITARPAKQTLAPSEPKGANEPTFVGTPPPTQLTSDTDELDLPKIEGTRVEPMRFDPEGRPVRQDTVVERPKPRSTAEHDALEYKPVSAVDSFGREMESFGAGLVGAFRNLFTTLRNSVLKPVREQAVATWSRIRGVKVKEFEQRGEDTFDRARAKQWENFNRGRTSSSYLQDTDRRHR